jgi:hypothetical protein
MLAERRDQAKTIREVLYAPDNSVHVHLTRAAKWSTVDRALEMERGGNVSVAPVTSPSLESRPGSPVPAKRPPQSMDASVFYRSGLIQ